MRKIELGYSNDFSGKANQVKCPDFTDQNIKDHYMLSNDSSLLVRNDGAALFIQNGNGRVYVSSNVQHSYSLSVEPGTVVIKF